MALTTDFFAYLLSAYTKAVKERDEWIAQACKLQIEVRRLTRENDELRCERAQSPETGASDEPRDRGTPH